MALYVINKINNKLKCIHRKNSFLISALQRLLCNALIQPHFDYACSAWYSNLTKKKKLLKTKCMRFWLQLDKLKHISHKEFQLLNWLPVTYRFKQCANSIVFKYFNEEYPSYLSEVFSFRKLKCPFCKTNNGQFGLSYLGLTFWNKILETLKRTNNLNTFTNNLKKHFLNELRNYSV